MKTIMAYVFSVAVLAGMIGLFVPVNVLAEGNGEELLLTIDITSGNNCTLNVVYPDSQTFDTEWTADTISQSSQMVVKSDTAPRLIRVQAEGGSKCELNNMNIESVVTQAEQAPGTNVAYVSSFGASGGSWRFVPSLAQILLYTGSDFTGLSASTITVTDATGAGHTEQSGALVHGGEKVVTTEITGLSLTDNYFSSSYVPLAANGTSGSLSFSTSATASESYKSAEIGIGGVVASDPEDKSGIRDLMVATDGDTATLKWTVILTAA
ncbi:hypothetical protein [Enterobacter asburiae]|uniref:hypothetical protein n=1 Tax=Enterobacter asburiae TaxID=61645 RepID=UPI0021CEADF0|nr:hypothetical protein [Enterobacter asburiae]MCU6244191.1 hypothetical protein [Enterobacter asburiae]